MRNRSEGMGRIEGMGHRGRAFGALLFVSWVMAGCAESETEVPPANAPDAAEAPVSMQSARGYQDITVEDLESMLEQKDFDLVNVHVPFEGDLPGTDYSIPFDQIAEHVDQLPADRDAKIVLYCRSGSMSTQAAEVLVGLGYTNVLQLSGGFRAWREAGLPMTGG